MNNQILLLERDIANMGFAVEKVPVPAGFSCIALSLVRDRERFAISPGGSVLAIRAAEGYLEALRDLAEDAYSRFSNLEPDGPLQIGIGSTEAEAEERARSNLWERLVIGLLPDGQRLMQDDHVPSEIRSFGGVNGSLRLSTPQWRIPVDLVVAELMLGRPPYYLAAVGCGRDAESRAVSNVMQKLTTYDLPRSTEAAWSRAARKKATVVAQTKPLTTLSDSGIFNSVSINTERIELFWVAKASLRSEFPLAEDHLLSPVDAQKMGLRTPTPPDLTYREQDVQLSRYFHENSKLRRRFKTSPIVDLAESATRIHVALANATRKYEHPRIEVELGDGKLEERHTVAESFRQRRSWVQMQRSALEFSELAAILKTAYGRTGSGAIPGRTEKLPLRATPSGGGLYPIDVFVVAEHVADMAKGLYYFNPDRNTLQLLNSNTRLEDIARLTGYPDRILSGSAILLLSGAFGRNQWKYWERGYRTVLLDCGHVAQSLVIAATSIDIVAHPIGGFIDDELNELLGLDGLDDSVLHLLLLGRREHHD